MNNIPGTLLGYTAVGSAAGLAAGAAINSVSHNSKDKAGSHDGLIGNNWDFIKTGASVGGVVALASAGIEVAARRSASRAGMDAETIAMQKMMGLNK